MKNLRRGIELVLLKLLKAFFASQSENTALRFGRQSGILACCLIGKRRRIALRNMELCGIGKNSRERKRIFRRCLENFGMTIAEFARLDSYSSKELIDKVSFDNFDEIERSFSYNRGAMLLSGHYDNWEILVQSIAARGYKMSMLVRQQHNLLVDDFINKMRSRENVEVILAEVSPRNILKALKDGRGMATLLDIWGGKDGKAAEFFGHKISTPSGAMEIAIKYNTPLVIGMVNRLKNGGHRIKIDCVIVPDELKNGNAVENLLNIYNQKLEYAIKRKPFFWLWTHKRFKDVTDYR